MEKLSPVKSESDLTIQKDKVPTGLKVFFILHFIVDTGFGIPFVFLTRTMHELFHLPTENLILGRMFGAAMIAIGGVSILVIKDKLDSFKSLLKLKLLWSASAIVGIGISLNENFHDSYFFAFSFFVLFFVVWSYYYFKLFRPY